MTTKSSADRVLAKKKILARIAVAQKQADAAKKAAKTAKITARLAKQKLKEADEKATMTITNGGPGTVHADVTIHSK